MFNTRTLIVIFFGLFWTLSGSVLFAQNHWETLPVFHNGRVMPLHTFARQIVREICGTERPYLVQDDYVIADFNQVIAALNEQSRQADAEQEEGTTGYRFLIPDSSFDGGVDRRYSIFNVAGDVQQINTSLPIQRFDRAQIGHLAERIRQIVPLEGRYFSADELLLSWICEPEVWRYIPLFLVSDSEYLDEIFNTTFAGDARTSQYRVSLYQLEKSQRYKQRLSEIHRRRELGQITKDPALFDQITERLESQSQVFLDLTFHPQRQHPTRMVSLLSQMLDEQSSFISAFSAWEHLLGLGEIPGRQATERSSNPDDLTFFHPTTQRWHNIVDKLHFLMRIYSRTDSTGNPILPNAIIVEQQYESLIGLIDANVAEAAALMEALYPGVSYRSNEQDQTTNAERLLPRLMLPENQPNRAIISQVAIRYYYSTKKLRCEVEAAYLALYDNGRSLRFLPILSPLVLEMGSVRNNVDVLPWASAPMILGSGEAFIKRFLDPGDSLSLSLTNEIVKVEENRMPVSDESDDFKEEYVEEEASEEEAEMPTERGMMSPGTLDDPLADSPVDSDDQSLFERTLFQPVGMRDGNIRLGPGDRGYIGGIRTRAREMLLSYSSPMGDRYGSADFLYRASQFQLVVSQAATRIEARRKLFIDSESRQMEDLFKKTAYPDPAPSRKLLAEYRYNRLHPFFWLGVFALLAVFLSGGAYVTAAARSKSGAARTVSIRSAAQGKTKETELADYTNSAEEWLFISSVVMLTFAILIAVFGGLMRAGITGWAPVTNMYETVVMMALAAALLGIWYALSPLLYPALHQAWVYSRFPGLGTMLEWGAAIKAKKAVASLEGDGESAMRAAAQEFGVPEGMTVGGRVAPLPAQNSEEWATQQRASTIQRKLSAQCLLALPRLILTLCILYLVVFAANGESIVEHGFLAALINMFAMSSTLDSLTILACVILIVWLIPHVLLALIMTPVVLFHPNWIAAELGIRSYEANIAVEPTEQNEKAKPPSTQRPRSAMSDILQGESQGIVLGLHNTSGAAWLKQARNALLDRKLIIAVTAAVVFITALIADWNRTEFNPDIKPIMAVLRNNFWLTVHVTAIIVSYAATFIAWGMAVVSLGFASFGRYQRCEPKFEGGKGQVLLPGSCEMFMPIIERLVKIALLLLIAGTVLGARWADFSWGRFWSWDPKEVWALITILFLTIILHGRIARYYGAFGITVGALFASVAVVFTWYGINFLPWFKNSVHAYGGGTESYASLFVLTFIVANLLWGTLALLRYNVEVYGNEAAE